MVFRKVLFIFLAAFLVFTFPAASQVIPAGEGGTKPLSIGAGGSSFNMDWGDDAQGHRRPLDGGAIWIDWHFYDLPRFLNGLGIEAEARDLSKFGPIELSKGYGDLNCDGNSPPNCQPNPVGMRQDTVEAGPIYTWRRYARFHPYFKFLIGFGSMDFPQGAATYPDGKPYDHDTRTVYAPGGGVEYRLTRSVDVRADYEYQFWPDFLGRNALNPHGLSVGATYSFAPHRLRFHP